MKKRCFHLIMKLKTFRKPVNLILLSGLFLSLVAFHKPIIQTGSNAYAEIRRFLDVFNAVRDSYVDDVNPQTLVDGAIIGLLNKLDPHSVFIPRDQTGKISEQFEGSYSGIGVDFVIQNNYPVIIAPMADSPAERLRLRSGDIILKLDDVSTLGKNELDVHALLRGEVGTLVRMTVQRPGFNELLVFNVIRDRVPVHSLRSAFMINDEIGYISLGRFSRTTKTEVSEALQKLEIQGLKKLVFDLRNNAGGYLEQAVATSDFFLPGGRRIVYTKGRSQSANEEFISTSIYPVREYPMVLLINQGTASSSEIMAAALQDWDRAAIVGEPSFGKGLVQKPISLKDGSAVRVTIARYYSPFDRPIQRPFLKSDEMSNIPQKDYFTYTGRKVYGSGGVQPDVVKKIIQITPSTAKLEAQMLFFEFVSSYKKKVREKYQDFPSFLKYYSIDNATFQRFLSFLQEKEVKYKNRELFKDRTYILQELKAEIARQIWGNEKYSRTKLETDPQFQAALGAFPFAERLAVVSMGNR